MTKKEKAFALVISRNAKILCSFGCPNSKNICCYNCSYFQHFVNRKEYACGQRNIFCCSVASLAKLLANGQIEEYQRKIEAIKFILNFKCNFVENILINKANRKIIVALRI